MSIILRPEFPNPPSAGCGSEDGASPVSSQPMLPTAGEAFIDPYERQRQEWIEYRKRRERGEPFTLNDFRIFAEQNAHNAAEDYEAQGPRQYGERR